MNCMKCGREIAAEDVFCADCLAEMEKYPVQPGTVVLLPKRRDNSSVKKAAKRRVITAEEQLAGLRKWVIWLALALIACIVAIVLMFKPTMHYIRDEHFEIGQNYSTVIPAAAPTTPAPAE